MIAYYEHKPIYIDDSTEVSLYESVGDIIFEESHEYEWFFPNYRPCISTIEMDGFKFLVIPIEPAEMTPDIEGNPMTGEISHEVLLRIE